VIRLNSAYFRVLFLLFFLLSLPENVYLHESQLNEVVIYNDRVVWYYEKLATNPLKPLSLNITLTSDNNTVILRYVSYSNASTDTNVKAQLRYYTKRQGQAINVNFLLTLQLSVGKLLLRESVLSKIIIANKSIKVQLHSYEIESPSVYTLINTPIERDVSSQFMSLAHSLGYHYITNAISLLKISMSTRGVLVRYSAFSISIDLDKYIKWLPSSDRVACRFINSTTMLILNTSNIVAYYTATHRINAMYTSSARDLHLSDSIGCLIPLIESLNDIALSLLTSILNSTQISKATLISIMDTVKHIAKVDKFLNSTSLSSTHYALHYSINAHSKHLKIRCIIAGSIPYNSINVLRLITVIHSHVANSTILKSINGSLAPYLPMFANVRYRNNSMSSGTTIRSSMRLVALAHPASKRAVLFLTLVLIAIQVTIVLYVFVRAIKNR